MTCDELVADLIARAGGREWLGLAAHRGRAWWYERQDTIPPDIDEYRDAASRELYATIAEAVVATIVDVLKVAERERDEARAEVTPPDATADAAKNGVPSLLGGQRIAPNTPLQFSFMAPIALDAMLMLARLAVGHEDDTGEAGEMARSALASLPPGIVQRARELGPHGERGAMGDQDAGT